MEASQQSDQGQGQKTQSDTQFDSSLSGLQTPQPDQPVPPVQETETAPETSQNAQPVSDQSASVPRDQVADEAQRQEEREVQRQEHSERTGGGAVEVGEHQAQRDEHRERTSSVDTAGANLDGVVPQDYEQDQA